MQMSTSPWIDFLHEHRGITSGEFVRLPQRQRDAVRRQYKAFRKRRPLFFVEERDYPEAPAYAFREGTPSSRSRSTESAPVVPPPTSVPVDGPAGGPGFPVPPPFWTVPGTPSPPKPPAKPPGPPPTPAPPPLRPEHRPPEAAPAGPHRVPVPPLLRPVGGVRKPQRVPKRPPVGVPTGPIVVPIVGPEEEPPTIPEEPYYFPGIEKEPFDKPYIPPPEPVTIPRGVRVRKVKIRRPGPPSFLPKPLPPPNNPATVLGLGAFAGAVAAFAGAPPKVIPVVVKPVEEAAGEEQIAVERAGEDVVNRAVQEIMNTAKEELPRLEDLPPLPGNAKVAAVINAGDVKAYGDGVGHYYLPTPDRGWTPAKADALTGKTTAATGGYQGYGQFVNGIWNFVLVGATLLLPRVAHTGGVVGKGRFLQDRMLRDVRRAMDSSEMRLRERRRAIFKLPPS